MATAHSPFAEAVAALEHGSPLGAIRSGNRVTANAHQSPQNSNSSAQMTRLISVGVRDRRSQARLTI
jgi:hypothetical protein